MKVGIPRALNLKGPFLKTPADVKKTTARYYFERAGTKEWPAIELKRISEETVLF